MNEERYEYLRNKYPNYSRHMGKNEPSKEKILKVTELPSVLLSDRTIDVNALIAKLRELTKKYPQFESIEVAFWGTRDDGIDILPSGKMYETDADRKLRWKRIEEQNELFDLMEERMRIRKLEEEKEQYMNLKRKFEDGFEPSLEEEKERPTWSFQKEYGSYDYKTFRVEEDEQPLKW